MTGKRRPDRQAAGGRDQASQRPGLDHGEASLVATDSPDDPQPDPDGALHASKPASRTD